MSADLFAEFGLNSTSTQSSNTRRQQTTHARTSSLIPDLDTSEDADFGDFTSPAPSAPSIGQQTRQLQYDDNVLFDATLETASNAGSDDWGEFETAEPSPAQQQPTGPIHAPVRVQGQSKSSDLLSGDLGLLSIEDKKPPSKPQARKVVPKKSPLPQSKASIKPPEPPEDDPFEDWGDFNDGPPSAPSPSLPRKPGITPGRTLNKQPPAQPERSASQAFNKISQESVPASQVRPTNIPPPSVLLELFPQVLDQLRQEATQARKNAQQKEALEAAASAITCTLKTAARVIAGRTHRWKRDAILSQSMRIGPARSGKAGGMKLSSVNKNEDIKEQQEAVDVITIWRDRAALFNSVVQTSGKRPVPVIPENVRALTASAEQGAIRASHACALCGLKRDERLPKVDEGVEDSFGEWWTDHWGHTDCKEFWQSKMKLLGQR
ncbi:uncharacterized protein ASPGLDRAFT_52713 [Aspergillus glaucus CBS 516.65]|uniref:Serine/threonine-protein kinase ppk6 n=1 Tax=Aspergillus glaucus CBS 516.65 TaxID=1160497 RepID=A0A1L9V695_ASPGL|nr:hypothetical protein ASPGLDRAFT_52713 [Aspergillus glaucus CBS 516.65]OJJ79445.1 hypothetical protein ASPGLDRAFT_52713 [Aspergillus glaucus CBS 516.65]